MILSSGALRISQRPSGALRSSQELSRELSRALSRALGSSQELSGALGSSQELSGAFPVPMKGGQYTRVAPRQPRVPPDLLLGRWQACSGECIFVTTILRNHAPELLRGRYHGPCEKRARGRCPGHRPSPPPARPRGGSPT